LRKLFWSKHQLATCRKPNNRKLELAPTNSDTRTEGSTKLNPVHPACLAEALAKAGYPVKKVTQELEF